MFVSFNARAVGLTGLSAAQTIELAAGAGFGGVDLMVRDLLEAGDDPSEVRARLEDRGLRAGAFPMPVAWRGEEARFRHDLEALKPIARAAQVIGLKATGTWVMPETPEPDSDLREVAGLHVHRLGDIARVLDDYEITLGLEVIGVESFRTGRGKPFVTRLSDLDHHLGAIWGESTNIGILLDAFHLHAANESIEAGLAWGIDKIVWVHVADLAADCPDDRSAIIDSDRGLPGNNGAVDLKGFLERLAREGYQGPVTVEPMPGCRSIVGLDPTGVVDRVKQSMDRIWPRVAMP